MNLFKIIFLCVGIICGRNSLVPAQNFKNEECYAEPENAKSCYRTCLISFTEPAIPFFVGSYCNLICRVDEAKVNCK